MVETHSAPSDGTSFHETVLALRARLAGRPADEEALPRQMLPFAWCFAIGAWASVLIVASVPMLAQMVQSQLDAVETAPAEDVRWQEPPVMPEPTEPTYEHDKPADLQGRPANCSEAQARGQTPAREGQPGYAPWLDGDEDGISCERWGRRSHPSWGPDGLSARD